MVLESSSPGFPRLDRTGRIRNAGNQLPSPSLGTMKSLTPQSRLPMRVGRADPARAEERAARPVELVKSNVVKKNQSAQIVRVSDCTVHIRQPLWDLRCLVTMIGPLLPRRRQSRPSRLREQMPPSSTPSCALMSSSSCRGRPRCGPLWASTPAGRHRICPTRLTCSV